MIACHFPDDDELVEQLAKCKGFDEQQARALVMQVKTRGYSPPKPQKIRQFQEQQDFPICPSGDPDACNVYKNLNFPLEVYEHIQHYYEEKANAATSRCASRCDVVTSRYTPRHASDQH